MFVLELLYLLSVAHLSRIKSNFSKNHLICSPQSMTAFPKKEKKNRSIGIEYTTHTPFAPLGTAQLGLKLELSALPWCQLDPYPETSVSNAPFLLSLC